MDPTRGAVGKSRTAQRLCTGSSCVQVTCPRRAGRLHRHPVRFGAIQSQNYRKLPTDSADEPKFELCSKLER